MADPTAYHRTACSLLRHSEGLLDRFVALPVRTKGFIVGAKSDRPIYRTAAHLAESGVPIITVEGSGHGFSEDAPAGLAEAIAGVLVSG